MFANLFMQFLYSAVIFTIGSLKSTIYRNKKIFFKEIVFLNQDISSLWQFLMKFIIL